MECLRYGAFELSRQPFLSLVKERLCCLPLTLSLLFYIICLNYLCSYTGTLASNGKKFDSSVDKGVPFEFNIGTGAVIKGWDEGVIKMSLGEKAVLHITSDYGYGSQVCGVASLLLLLLDWVALLDSSFS